jgi:hypothetical protein
LVIRFQRLSRNWWVPVAGFFTLLRCFQYEPIT